jgi:hypothetical protein
MYSKNRCIILFLVMATKYVKLDPQIGCRVFFLIGARCKLSLPRVTVLVVEFYHMPIHLSC